MTENENATTDRAGQSGAVAIAAQTATDIVNAMGEGVVLFKLDGTITSVNPAVEGLTDLQRDDLVGRNLRDIVPLLLEGNDLVMAMRALEEVAKGLMPVLDHVVLRHKTASPVTISLSVAFIHAADGTPASVVLTLKDITELHRSEELLNQVFDNTHMQVAFLDPGFHFVRVNLAYADVCGHAPGFFTGKNHFELYPDAENEAIFRKVRDTGEPFAVFEKPFAFPDQPERGMTYWDWSLKPVRNEKGIMVGLLLCLMNVTERVQTRKRFEESDKKYRELVENANSIIIRITPELRVLFFNEYAQRFFGYSSQEILGRSVLGTIVPPVDSEGRDLRAMTEAVRAHPELHGSIENENVCKDGRRVWVHWSNRALRDEQGAVREILCVGTDITQRIKLTRQAEHYRRHLKRLVDRLVTTEEQERRRVATHIHDTVVQTLSLSNIRLGGVLAALEKAGLSGLYDQVAGVRQLLDQGTVECRGLMAELVPSLLYEVGLQAALRDYVQKLNETSDGRISLEGDVGNVPLDDIRRAVLFQSARELIMNALKYAGWCKIRVLLAATGKHIALTVQDNGRGFDPSVLKCRESDHSEGGFGFFNIRERVEGLDGSFEVDATPGQGTTATVRVPLVKSH